MNKYIIYKLARKDEDKCSNVHNGRQWKEPCYIKIRDLNKEWHATDNLDLVGQPIMFHRGFGFEYVCTSTVQAVTVFQEEEDLPWGPHVKAGDVLFETKNSYYLGELYECSISNENEIN